MTNTYMLNGEDMPEDIIKSVKRGLYAVNFGGGQVDITNGKFVFSASEAYLIEDGVVTRPVKGATLIGNGPEALKYVSMVGNDLALDEGIGTCGKAGAECAGRCGHADGKARPDDGRAERDGKSMAAAEREKMYECEVRRRRVKEGGGYEPFWKVKNVADALVGYRYGVPLQGLPWRGEGAGQDEQGGHAGVCGAQAYGRCGVLPGGLRFKKATDGRVSRWSEKPVA